MLARRAGPRRASPYDLAAAIGMQMHQLKKSQPPGTLHAAVGPVNGSGPAKTTKT